MSISFNLDAKAIQDALIMHLRDNLGFKTEGKEFAFTFVTGRKTRNNPNPETVATVTVTDAKTKQVEAVTETTLPQAEQQVSEPETAKVEESPSLKEEPVENVSVEEPEDDDILPLEEEVAEPSITEDDDDLFDEDD